MTTSPSGLGLETYGVVESYRDPRHPREDPARQKGWAMTVGELIERLKRIVNVHAEADEATVWGVSEESGHKFQVKNVGYDTKRRPYRVKLED